MKKTLALLTAALVLTALSQSVWACIPEWEHGNPDATSTDCGFVECSYAKSMYFNIYWWDSSHTLTAHRTQFETHGTGYKNSVSCWPQFYDPHAEEGPEGTGTGSWTQRVISQTDTSRLFHEQPGPARCVATEDHYFTEVDNCFVSETGGGEGGGGEGGGGGEPVCSMEIIPTGYWDDCVRYDDLYGEFCVGGWVYVNQVYEICH